MPDYWGFCDEYGSGRFFIFLEKGKDGLEKFEKHLLECEGCRRAQKRVDDFDAEMSKCADGT